MKTIVLGLTSVICGGIALMPLLVQPDPERSTYVFPAAMACVTTWLCTRSSRGAS